MKKMWFIISLAMLSFVSQSFAATFNKGLILDSVGFENTVSNSINADQSQTFSATRHFTTPENVSSVAISITNVAIKLSGFAIGAINNFRTQFNGEDLEPEQGGSGFVLLHALSGASSASQTNPVLQVTGIVPKDNLSSSNGGNITVTNQDSEERPKIPVPSVVWLLGSALLGLLGITRRKETVDR